jgi:hypothetical protein
MVAGELEGLLAHGVLVLADGAVFVRVHGVLRYPHRGERLHGVLGRRRWATVTAHT